MTIQEELNAQYARIAHLEGEIQRFRAELEVAMEEQRFLLKSLPLRMDLMRLERSGDE